MTSLAAIISRTPIAYWPQDETSGATAEELVSDLDGAYIGATLAQIAAPGGGLAPGYDGNDYANLYTAGLAAAFNGALGSMVVWWRMLNGGVWSDGTLDVIFEVYASATNFVRVLKDTVTNKLSYFYTAGGTSKTAITYDMISDGWHLSVITWDKANDQVKIYGDNAQIGSTLTGLGTWVGSIVSCTVGRWNAYTTFYLKGYSAHAALFDHVLTLEDVQVIYAALPADGLVALTLHARSTAHTLCTRSLSLTLEDR